jgi:hypothetical protein
MGVLVFKGSGSWLPLVLAVLAVICWWCGRFKHIVIQVPGRQRELVPRGRCRVEQVMGMCLIEGSQDGRCLLLPIIAPLFMLLRRCQWWYSFSKCGDCRWVSGSHVLSLSGYPFHLIRYCNCFCFP